MSKILLFDEEVILSNEIREGFELKNSKIVPAYTYAEAISLIKASAFDAVLIDVVIPFDKIDRELNPNLVNNLRTGIEFKKHIVELIAAGEIKNKPKIYYFTARTDLTEDDQKNVDGTILKPKRPSEIFKKLAIS